MRRAHGRMAPFRGAQNRHATKCEASWRKASCIDDGAMSRSTRRRMSRPITSACEVIVGGIARGIKLVSAHQSYNRGINLLVLLAEDIAARRVNEMSRRNFVKIMLCVLVASMRKIPYINHQLRETRNGGGAAKASISIRGQ